MGPKEDSLYHKCIMLSGDSVIFGSGLEEGEGRKEGRKEEEEEGEDEGGEEEEKGIKERKKKKKE